MAFLGTSLHIPFTGSPSKPKQQQILKGIERVSIDDILETHLNKSLHKEQFNTKISHLTNVAGNIPNISLKPIEVNNQSSKPSNKHHIKQENKKQWHRRTGREEDLDYNPSLMRFLTNPTKVKSKCSRREKRLLADAHHNITQQMLKSINNSSKDQSQYKLLPTVVAVTAPDKMDEKDLNDSKFFDNINNGTFTTRFDLNYNDWMQDNENNKQEFVNEISKALKVQRYEIKINNIRQGSVIVDFIVKNIWIPLYIKQLEPIRSQDEYFMRSQDQIEVKYEEQWYAATICTVIDDGNQNGKNFKIRYNPKEGKNVFWRNTEWFFSKKQASRLRFTDQLYTIITDQGEKKRVAWTPPTLTNKDTVNDIEINNHIFVNFKGHWRRCVVIHRIHKLKGVWIKVVCLMNGDKKELMLWKNQDVNLISFKDMRDHPMGMP